MSEKPTPPRDPRAFDIAAGDFANASIERFEAGRVLALADTERLWALARRVAGDLGAWASAHQRLEVAQAGPFPPEGCGRRLVEALFDDALTSPAARVFLAALDLAFEGALPSITGPHAPDGRAPGR